MYIEPVMPSNRLILCHPLLLLPSIFPSIRVLSDELALHIRWPKYWSFSFSMDKHKGKCIFFFNVKLPWSPVFVSQTYSWTRIFLASNGYTVRSSNTTQDNIKSSVYIGALGKTNNLNKWDTSSSTKYSQPSASTGCGTCRYQGMICPMSFYIRDLSICGFWYQVWVLEPISYEYWGMTSPSLKASINPQQLML